MKNPVIYIMFLFALALPLGLLLWWRKKMGARLWIFIAGALCFFLFANILEGLLHQACLMTDNPVSRAIMGSPVLYALYGIFAAGIFEETGRLFGFRVLLRHRTEKETAVAYGIGHGGIEVLLTLGTTYLLYLLAARGVSLGDEAMTAQYAAAADAVPFGPALLAMLERVSAVMLHIGLSMLMFTACRDKKKLWLYPVCICLHALADLPACLYQYKMRTPYTGSASLGLTEALIFVIGLAVLLLGRRVLNAAFAAPAEKEPEEEGSR